MRRHKSGGERTVDWHQLVAAQRRSQRLDLLGRPIRQVRRRTRHPACAGDDASRELIMDSASHSTTPIFEMKSRNYNRWTGKVITSTTYHSLHHSRYTGNYGLGTRVLDKIFKTEWEDYERLYDRLSREKTSRQAEGEGRGA
jgi:hypothetical protein